MEDRTHIVTIVEKEWYISGIVRYYPVCKDNNCGWMGRSYTNRTEALRRGIKHQKTMRFAKKVEALARPIGHEICTGLV